VDKKMKEKDVIYISGIIDGEGCIGIFKENPKRKQPVLRPLISITNSNHQLLKYLLKRLPRVKPTFYKRDIIFHKNWTLIFRKQEIVESILKDILPFLVAKKEQANLVLKFINLRKQNNRYSQEEWKLYTKVKNLNNL
jgi:hypothetical protein